MISVTGADKIANLSYWVAIFGFLFLMFTAITVPILASRKTVRKLGTPNGDGDSLFDVGTNAAISAEAAKMIAASVAYDIDQNFLLVFNRLTQQDSKITSIEEKLGL
jgi:hypothetical protein